MTVFGRLGLAVSLVSCLLFSGCYLRKDDREESFPDEFALGMDATEESEIEYVQMDDSEESVDLDLDWDSDTEQPSGDLIASADHALSNIHDDTTFHVPEDSSHDSLAPPSAMDRELSENESDPERTQPVIMGGAVIPPRQEETVEERNRQDVNSPDSPTIEPDTSLSLGNAGSGLSKHSGQEGFETGFSLKRQPDLLPESGAGFSQNVSDFRNERDPFSVESPDLSASLAPPAVTGDLAGRFDSTETNPIVESHSRVPSSPSRAGGEGSRVAQAIASVASPAKEEPSSAPLEKSEVEIGNISRQRSITLESRPENRIPVASSPTDGKVDDARSEPSLDPDRNDLPDPKTLKRQGIDSYHQRRFGEAITAFRDYLSAYTEEEDAVRAWLGYALMQDRRYGEASKEFTILLNSDNPELRADAHYHLGLIHDKQGNFEAAKVRWEQVIKTYPDTKAAEKARKSLGQTSP